MRETSKRSHERCPLARFSHTFSKLFIDACAEGLVVEGFDIDIGIHQAVALMSDDLYAPL